VGEVGVHRDDRLVTLVERGGEPVSIGRAEALLAAPVQDLDAAQFGRCLLGERGRSVGAVVVDDQHIGVGRGLAHRVQEPHDVLRLVVGRQHDDGTHGQRA
jgi:hypothetical protein